MRRVFLVLAIVPLAFSLTAFGQRNDPNIAGTEPLPLDEILPLVGLRITDSGGKEAVEFDPQASSDTKRLWNDLVKGR